MNKSDKSDKSDVMDSIARPRWDITLENTSSMIPLSRQYQYQYQVSTYHITSSRYCTFGVDNIPYTIYHMLSTIYDTPPGYVIPVSVLVHTFAAPSRSYLFWTSSDYTFRLICGRTSRGHTGGRQHRSFFFSFSFLSTSLLFSLLRCGAVLALIFNCEKD